MDRQSGCVYGAGACLAVIGILSLLVAEESGRVFESASGQPGSVDALPRGEVPLYSVLQGLADVSGARVILRTNDPPETRLLLSRPLEPFDESGAVRTLEGAGFQVKRFRRAGKTELEVGKAPVSARPKGKLKPSGAGSPAGSPEAAPERPAAERAPIAGSPGGPRLYELHEGAGSRYVVILETDSREEAEDALKLLEAQRSSRSAKKSGENKAEPTRTEGTERGR